AHLEQVLRALSLWDKRGSKIMTLSGGMKRRLLIAKALSHEPRILFLDEPTAGVDVELRRDMWQLVRELRATGVTVILTTHYIEEAEQMADRIGVISKGELILVEQKTELMHKLGRKQVTLQLQRPLAQSQAPADWAGKPIVLSADGSELTYTYESGAGGDGSVGELLRSLAAAGIGIRDLHTRQSTLEDIFVSLVSERRAA
ncbi:MAG: ABC transporter ATP-binding protein, partial [Burkholderiales bacterium]|nr:ABC transporter ATP-binding protein [Burkholderiales bacterium]